MKQPTKESIRIAGYISEFLNNYVFSQKTDSMNTLESYRDTLALYLTYLEEEKRFNVAASVPVRSTIQS